MRGVSGVGKAIWPQYSPPGNLIHIVSTGDSMSVGTDASSAGGDIVSTRGNKRLFDSSGVYDTSNPNAATLSLQTLKTPQRTIGTGGAYPANLFGYSIEYFVAEQLTALALASHYSGFKIHPSACGQFAEPLSAMVRGQAIYNASLYELRAAIHLNGSAFVRAVVATLGGIDAVFLNTSFQSQFATFAANYDSDLRGISGQSAPVLTFASQSIALPNYGGGQDYVGPAQLAAGLTGGLVVCTGSRYAYPTSTDRSGHLSDYSGLGCKAAQAIWEHLQLGIPWLPLYPSSVVRSGTTITHTFAVRYPPLAWASQNDNDDHTATAPHVSGGYAPITPWAPGNGFEAWGAMPTPNSATNATPVVVGFPMALPAYVTTGSMVYFDGIGGNTNACGAYFVTRQDSQHLALYHDAARTGPVAGNGVATFSSPATRAFAVIPITSVAISGNTVTVTIGYDPGAGNLTSAYAMTADGWGTASANFGTGGFPSGRCGLLRDSDRMTDILGRRQYNWACSFLQAGL